MSTYFIGHKAIYFFNHFMVLSNSDSKKHWKDGDWLYYKNGKLEGVVQVKDGSYPKAMFVRKIIISTDEQMGVTRPDMEWVEEWKKNPVEIVYPECTLENECAGECGICNGDCNGPSVFLNVDGCVHFLKIATDFIEPVFIQAGDPKLKINGNPPRVDCRVISEDMYQKLIQNQRYGYTVSKVLDIGSDR